MSLRKNCTKVLKRFTDISRTYNAASDLSQKSGERVVVTGFGIVCPLGSGVNHVWSRLLRGDIGCMALSERDYKDIPCKVAAFVPRGNGPGELNIDKEFKKSQLNTFSLATAYALIAAKEALADANWHPQSETDCEATGVAVGMGMVDLGDIITTGNILSQKGYSKVSPYFVPRILANMPAGQISIQYGFRGPNHSVSTACTTGVHAIGDAFNFIRNGHASVMVCGGTEAVICPLSIAAFARMRALSTNFNSDPSKASRPFDKKRDGFVMGEGAGILVLETFDHALKRNAKIYAEVLGYGLSSDAHHITSPRYDGRGAYACMNAALKNSGMNPLDVGYINAHATSTPLGDIAEARAIYQLFGNHIKSLKVSSTKGAVGHLLGAAGSVEAIFTILACNTGNIPPTVNLYDPESELDINYVPLKSQVWPEELASRRIGITNSFGFGGTNATVVFSNII